MKYFTWLFLVMLSTGSAFAQFPDSKVDGWAQAFFDLQHQNQKDESEKLQYQATSIEYKDNKVVSGVIKNGEQIICQLTDLQPHPQADDVLYQDCGNGNIVTVYKDNHWIKEFHFQVYAYGENEAFAQAWIDLSDCTCLDPKKPRPAEMVTSENALQPWNKY